MTSEGQTLEPSTLGDVVSILPSAQSTTHDDGAGSMVQGTHDSTRGQNTIPWSACPSGCDSTVPYAEGLEALSGVDYSFELVYRRKTESVGGFQFDIQLRCSRDPTSKCTLGLSVEVCSQEDLGFWNGYAKAYSMQIPANEEELKKQEKALEFLCIELRSPWNKVIFGQGPLDLANKKGELLRRCTKFLFDKLRDGEITIENGRPSWLSDDDLEDKGPMYRLVMEKVLEDRV
ncbi:hypothetical protein QFC19_000666 [Naganishia cerealis]|uniref:Uncharacterized protein n=1 Tax=Naganishia cerealis TaxID=610337 RepID=A0ACC2WP98_9TREE|nr:hypothetical protein QFC19_000666 [Naganishia cerealis]